MYEYIAKIQQTKAVCFDIIFRHYTVYSTYVVNLNIFRWRFWILSTYFNATT